MRCRACGHPIVMVRDLGPPINLDRYRVHHVLRVRDFGHDAIPPDDWEDHL